MFGFFRKDMCNRSQAGRECKQPELEGPSLKENTYCSPVIWSTLKWSSERGGSWTILYLFCMYIFDSYSYYLAAITPEFP